MHSDVTDDSLSMLCVSIGYFFVGSFPLVATLMTLRTKSNLIRMRWEKSW